VPLVISRVKHKFYNNHTQRHQHAVLTRCTNVQRKLKL